MNRFLALPAPTQPEDGQQCRPPRLGSIKAARWRSAHWIEVDHLWATRSQLYGRHKGTLDHWIVETYIPFIGQAESLPPRDYDFPVAYDELVPPFLEEAFQAMHEMHTSLWRLTTEMEQLVADLLDDIDLLTEKHGGQRFVMIGMHFRGGDKLKCPPLF